ncbi:hypothetical protein KHA80_22620 [Anaerobacillus sp. HL2]|nr:hypothetical protein KHA80_22620 [Anaerobacillus sp. HL2]
MDNPIKPVDPTQVSQVMDEVIAQSVEYLFY